MIASIAALASPDGGRAAAAAESLPPECATEAAEMPGNPPQHPASCHGNPNFNADGMAVMSRGDVASLPAPLKNQLARLACRPHSTLPIQFYGESDTPSQLFQYYLLDTKNFEPNVFTARLPGVNDTAMFTATGANCGLPTVAAVRLVLEPKPGLPNNPDDPRAFIDIITDLSGVFVINNESGWYEGWMIHDLRVAQVAPPGPDGHAKFGTITSGDAARLAKMGSGNNVPGHTFTVDGNAPHFPSASDHFPDKVTNVVPIQLSMGAYNALQQSDAHQYWEFNYTTNWIHPLYELPFTGGFPDHKATDPAETFQEGQIGREASIVPGNRIGLNQDKQRTVKFGDDPSRPRDPDLFDADVDSQREFRQRFIPSGLAREVLLNAFERLSSFRSGITDLQQRLEESYKAALDVADTNHDGIISAAEGDIDTCNPNCFPATPSDECPVSDNSCLYLSPRSYDRFAVTREINDGYIAPRFAPSQRAWVLSGSKVDVSPAVNASEGRDSDDR
ncbi:EF-hand domain-containing protein [Anaeromyxobacter oryzae]|uniref:hypothetical protein n=1 Tax=Anaeromyxobacter oryzae TaxID=2918170 RepID=UPI0020C092E3|nr:hypothetical protein [Anaeromyxobacter oryzae]